LSPFVFIALSALLLYISLQTLYSILTRDRELISDRVSIDEINRLCGMTGDGRALSYGAPSRLFPDGEPILGPRLIVPHKKQGRTFLVAVGVHPSLVRAELRRKMTNRLPIAEDNRTVVREPFSNEKGSGFSFEPKFRVCFGYLTTPKCAKERSHRQMGGITEEVAKAA
jgi:hypothetical protein